MKIFSPPQNQFEIEIENTKEYNNYFALILQTLRESYIYSTFLN